MGPYDIRRRRAPEFKLTHYQDIQRILPTERLWLSAEATL